MTVLVWTGVIAVCLLSSTNQVGELAEDSFALFWRGSGAEGLFPHLDLERVSYVAQKLIHVLLFGGLGVMSRRLSWPAAGWRFTAGVALCLVSEALQWLMPARSAEWRDAALNLITFLSGFTIASTALGRNARGVPATR